MATNETPRLGIPYPGENDRGVWYGKLQTTFEQLDAAIFANLENIKPIFRQLPTVEHHVSHGIHTLIQTDDWIMLSRTSGMEITVPDNTGDPLVLLQDNMLGVRITPGLSVAQVSEWELFPNGAPVDGAVQIFGWVDTDWTVYWFNGNALVPTDVARLFAPGVAAGAAGTLLVTGADPVPGYGSTKIVGGTAITVSVLPPTPVGERLEIAFSGSLASTLDEAYDGGGAGLGRSITADAGAVAVTVPLTTASQSALLLTQSNTAATAGLLGLVNNGAATAPSLLLSGTTRIIESAAGNLTVQTTSSGTLGLTSAGLLDVNAGANLDVDVTGTTDLLGTGTINIQGGDTVGLKLVTTNAADKTLTISAANAGAGNAYVAITADQDITFNARSNSLTFNDASNLTLNGTFYAGITSVVGALNQVVGGFVPYLNADDDVALGAYGLSGATINAVDSTLAIPATPVITQGGTPGTTAYTYKIVVLFADGRTTNISAAGTTATGAATLTAINYNHLAWTAYTDAYRYLIYRTASAGTPSSIGLLAVQSGTTYDDIGIDAGSGINIPSAARSGLATLDTVRIGPYTGDAIAKLGIEGSVSANGSIRSTGVDDYFHTGAGTELQYVSGVGLVMAHNRDTGLFMPLCLNYGGTGSQGQVFVGKTAANGDGTNVFQIYGSAGIEKLGTVTADTDLLSLTNMGNASSMTNTRGSIRWNQWYYDGSTPAIADAAKITVGTEGNWNATASNQDSYMSFSTCLDGTVAEKVRINSAGYIGINNINPLVFLDVQGIDGSSTFILRNASTTSAISFLTGGSGGGIMRLHDTGGTLTNQFYGAGDSFITSGNLVIGATSASCLLDLQKAGTATADTNLLELTNSGNAASMADTRTSILFNQWYYDAVTPAVADIAKITVGNYGNWTSTASTQDGYMAFFTTTDGTLVERMRLDPLNNVLINATSTVALAQSTLVIGNTAYGPSAHTDNQISIYSIDTADNTATIGIQTEQAIESIGTFTPSHKVKIIWNQVAYWIQLDAV